VTLSNSYPNQASFQGVLRFRVDGAFQGSDSATFSFATRQGPKVRQPCRRPLPRKLSLQQRQKLWARVFFFDTNSPVKSGLRQPSAASGSRIPRIGTKPYTRPTEKDSRYGKKPLEVGRRGTGNPTLVRLSHPSVDMEIYFVSSIRTGHSA